MMEITTFTEGKYGQISKFKKSRGKEFNTKKVTGSKEAG